MVMQTLSNITLYVHRPSFLTIQFTLASIMSVYAYMLRIVIANCKMPSNLPISREISRTVETYVRQLLLLESLCIVNSTLRFVLLYRNVFYEDLYIRIVPQAQMSEEVYRIMCRRARRISL